MAKPNETFNETSSSPRAGDEAVASAEKPANAEWRKRDDGGYKKKPNDKDEAGLRMRRIQFRL